MTKSVLIKDQLLAEKYQLLVDSISALGNAAVSYSGGVDSSLLVAAAKDAFGEGSDNLIAITVRSQLMPEREVQSASEFCKELGVKHVIMDEDELGIEGFAANPPDRCYLCKTATFSAVKELAATYNIENILEGTNADDTGDYRPGRRAVDELGIRSPLLDANLTKQEIRDISKAFGLTTASKQSFACLASRFPYGEQITKEKLVMVDKAEQLLMDLGFTQLRVRAHGENGDLARIEITRAEFPKLLDGDTLRTVTDALRGYGFKYISLDLDGYRTGSMNEVLSDDARENG
jgi:uncharacterized protein